MLAAMMQHVFAVTPKEVSTTVSSTILGIYFYVSAVVSSIGGSVVYENYGGARLFFGISLCCAAWCVVMVVRHICVTCNQKEDVTEITLSTVIHNEQADGPVVAHNEQPDGSAV